MFSAAGAWHVRAGCSDPNRYGQLGVNLGLPWAQFAALDHDHWFTVVERDCTEQPPRDCWVLASADHYSRANVKGTAVSAQHFKRRLPGGTTRTTDLWLDNALDDDDCYEMVPRSSLTESEWHFTPTGGWALPVGTVDPTKVVKCHVLTPNVGSYQQNLAIIENTGVALVRDDCGKGVAWRMVKPSGSDIVRDFMYSGKVSRDDQTAIASPIVRDSDGYWTVDMSFLPFPAGSTIRKIAVGDDFSAWLLDDGSLWTCGANTRGQLGVGTAIESDTLQIFPVQVAIGPVHDISAAGQSLAVLLEDGSLGVCGANTFGQLGTGDKSDRRDIVEIDSGVEAIEMCRANLLYRKCGAVLATGYNGDGRFPNLPAELT